MWWSRKEASPPPEPAAAPAALPVTRAEWRSLPPIQRVVADHPMVNPVQRFSSSLTSWQSPGYLEPLGHRVGPDEPAGVIGDLARPRTSEAPAPAMPVVQRATRKPSGLSRLWGASVQRDASPEAAVPTPEEPAPVQLLPEEPAPLPMPSLVLPAVASREVFRPLTSAGSVALPASPPVRTVQAIREETPVAEPSAVDTPAAAELPLAEPETVLLQAPEPAPAESSPAEPAPPVLPVVQRTEQAAPRRLGLGAPILPDAGNASPPIAPSDAPLAGAVETSVLPADEAPEPTQVTADAPLPVSRLADPVPPSPPSGSGSPEMSVKATLRETKSLNVAFTDIGTPGEVTVSRMAESLPTATSSRSSPVNTFLPLGTPDLRSGTTEPPGTPGGSTSVSPPPAPTAPTPPLPVARAVETPELPVSRVTEVPQLAVARAVEDSVTPAVENAPLPVAPTIEASSAPSVESSSYPVVPTVSLPVARAVEDSPALAPAPVARAVEGSPLPVTRPVETPVSRVAEDSPLPVTRAAETPVLPVTPLLPVARAVETPALPVSRAVETPTLPATPALPVAQAAEGPALPVARAIETSALPGARAGETVPVARAIETPALPVARVAETPALPVARVAEGAAPPVQRAVETPPLPVARTLDAPAPTIPSPGTLPTVSIPTPVRPTETASLPTLPVSRAIDTPPAPMTLPVARVLDAPASMLQRTEAAGAGSSPGAPTLSEALPFAQRQEAAAVPQPGTPLPVARSIETPDSRSLSASSEPLPVARIAENGRPDFLRTVQRATNGSPPHGEALTLNVPPVVVSRQEEVPTVQREPEPPAPEPAPAPAPPAPAAAAPPPAAALPETDELVKKLFDPLLRRLKTELRLDRERRGALTDRPH